jgi:protein-disulfide isomerase
VPTEFGVNSTPTFLINGKRYAGAMSVETMSALIDKPALITARS